MCAARLEPTCSHWGNYLVETDGTRITGVRSYDTDPHPTPISKSLVNALDRDVRVLQPMVRKGYLERRFDSDGSRRGQEPFVPVDWDTALDLAADALERTRSEFGNESIYGGSYGWASAGRFHHANSQIHRFLNTIGGYTASITSYSAGAAEVIVPHVLGMDFYEAMFSAPTVADMIDNTKLVVCFGGIAMKNTQIMSGGLGAHTALDQLRSLKEADLDYVNISPVRDDMADFLEAEWWPCRPVSDVAIMMGLAHTLVSEGLYDRDFIERYTVGLDRFTPYLLGETDGQPKDADWAAKLSEIPADSIRALARRMANETTLIGISWSLQRSEHGEQSYWMATVLGALLGTLGLPGAGVAYGYGSVHAVGFAGRRMPNFRVGALPQGQNPVRSFIPVSRIADMLLDPGAEMAYNGRTITLPDIRTVCWAGGNPFHHHQDLNRLRHAWAKPETIIIHEPFWTAAARHADIVFPSTTPLERNDLGASPYDCYMSPMRQAVAPLAKSRSDFDTFADLADRLESREAFTEDRDEMAWVETLYETTRSNAAGVGVELPDFDTFWAGQQIDLTAQIPDKVFRLEKFRADPAAEPLRTPSGRIEIFSEKIDGFAYDDCPGHAAWFDKVEFLGASRAAEYPLHLISNQPRTRLHSQYDHGVTSRARKIEGRERARMHPDEAVERGISDGDIVRLYNDRGACLAGIELSDAIRPGVIELPTGAWYDPEPPGEIGALEVHGNPNVLTRDVGTSRLAQGPTAHSCLVEVERFDGELPSIRAFSQPPQAPGG